MPGLDFANPWFLLLLLAIPVLAYLHGRKGGAPSVVFSSTRPMRELGRRAVSKAGKILSALIFLALATWIVALARPRLGESITHTQASGIDIVLALDVSRSMLAKDFRIGAQRASRIEAIKKVTREFIESRPNDRIGIVAFAGRPYLVSPLTLDHDWLLENLDRVKVGLVEDGTAIGSAIASASNRIRTKQAESKVLVLLTDGDNNAGRITPIAAAEAAKTLGIRIYTIGAGTRGLAPYPVGRDMFGNTVFRNVPVDFDEKSLEEIAKIGNGRYYRATNTKSLQEIFAAIDELEKSIIDFTQYKKYTDLFHWFAGAGTLLLSVQLVLGQTVLRRIP